jgi:hypothetical protein
MSSRHPALSSTVDLGVVLSKGLSDRLAAGCSIRALTDGLRDRLSARLPETAWNVVGWGDDAEQERQAAAGERLPLTGLLAAARAVVLARDLDIVVWLTDQPIELHGRPVVAQSSAVQHVVVRSVDPTEPIGQVLDDAADLTLELFDLGRGGSDMDVLAALTRTPTTPPHGFVARLVWNIRHVGENSRLFLRQVRATRPWLLTRHLTRALVGAAAAAGIAVVTPDFWMLADRMNGLRLVVVTALALAAAVAVIVIGGGLREHGRSGRATLHNAAVWTSVTFGVVSLYAGLVVISVAVTFLVLPWALVSQTLGHPVGWGTMVRVGALTAAVALTGSVFGAGLEEDDTLKEAAFGESDDVRYVDQEAV